MDFEMLEKNYPNNEEYYFKVLLRNLKDLDNDLTKYLVQDFYKYEEKTRKNILDDIAVISNICKYILEGIEYDFTHFDNFMEDKINHSYNVYKSWESLGKIKQLLEKYKIDISFNKGFDFGIGICNYASIKILYSEEIGERSYQVFHIFSISTHDGSKFQINKCGDYYKKLKYSNFERSNATDGYVVYDSINETVEKIKELYLEFQKKLVEEKEMLNKEVEIKDVKNM